MKGVFLAVLASIVVFLGGIHVAAAAEAPVEWDGLVKRDVKGFDLVYVRPDVPFPAYKKVILDPVQVAFAKSWKPPQRLDAQDLQRIKDALAAMVSEGFSKKLAVGGYTVTSAPDDDTIRVSAT